MLWIVSTVIFAAIVAVAFVLRRRERHDMLPARQDQQDKLIDTDRVTHNVNTGVLIGIPVVWVVWTLVASVHMISAGHVGVV